MNRDAQTSGNRGPSRPGLVLAAIVVLGLGLRLWGIDWGRPRVDLNPDELNILEVTSGITFGDLDPGFYSYSGLTFHLNFFSGELLEILAGPLGRFDQLLLHRLWSVLWGTLTILVVYCLARDLLGSRRAGLFAAAGMAITPLHLWDSHLGTTDVPLAFWMVLATWAGVRAYRRPELRRFVVGGMAVGFGVGVKFNAALAGVTFLAAAVAAKREDRLRSWGEVAGRLLAAGLASIVSFAVSSPYSLINLRETVAAFWFEWRHVRAGHFGFDLLAEGWQYHRGVYQLAAALPFAFGFALYGLVLVGLVRFARRRPGADVAVGTAFVALYFLSFASYNFVPIRYYLPILPVLLAVSAGLPERLWAEGGWRRALLLGILAYTGLFAATSTSRFSLDTRIEAADWANANLTPEASVVLVEPIFGDAYMPRLEDSRFRLASAPIGDLEGIVAGLRSHPSGYVCLSSLSYQRFYREGDPEKVRLWDWIRRNPEWFERVRVFEGWYLNRDVYTALDPMYGGYFISPTIEFYRFVGRRRVSESSGDSRFAEDS